LLNDSAAHLNPLNRYLLVKSKAIATNSDAEIGSLINVIQLPCDKINAERRATSIKGPRTMPSTAGAKCKSIFLRSYHLMHTIRFKLRHKGVKFCWTTIRRQLSTHVRATTTMKWKVNKVIKIRKSSKTEPAHEVIYDAPCLSYRPGRIVKTIL